MARGGRVIDRDRGWKRIEAEMRAMKKGAGVTVGIQGNEANETHGKGSDYTNAQIGTVHEFGSIDGTIPERSFIRSTMDAQSKPIAQLAARLMAGVIVGKMTRRKGLGILGQHVLGEIRKTIRAGIDPPLQQATIDRKGSSKPLIDTGQLVGSLTYKVRG
jgi:hypothetical protein